MAIDAGSIGHNSRSIVQGLEVWGIHLENQYGIIKIFEYFCEATITGVPLQFDAISIIFTMAGKAFFEVDSQEYELGQNTLLNLIGVKILRNVRFSDDFKGYHLLISKEFYDEVFKEGKHL
ncbi:MAG: hypothetical protein ACI3ZN_09950, partial [Candidatus Cryptobacteroides sp.]